MGKKLRQINRFLRRRKKPTYHPSPKSKPLAKPTKPGTRTWRIPRKYIALVMLIFLAAVFARNIYRFDRLIIPLVLDAAELRLQAEINNVINNVINQIIQENNVTAADFILKSQLLPEQPPILSVNTVLANEINNSAAQRISEKLNNLEPETVYVPMGMAFGIDMLAQFGPRFSFDLAPIGNALVNYESSFTAVGINQTHFAVWLNVESIVRIINPVQSSEIFVSRSISLVDTIISGTVPYTYLNMDVPFMHQN